VRRPDKRKLRAEMETAILKNSKNLMQAVIRQGERGNYLHVKYLLDFAGIQEPLPEPGTEATPAGLMDILLGTAKSAVGAEEAAEAAPAKRKADA
jgi:hypothetical protein